MYLSDIQWFDYHQGIYDINNRKEIKSSDSPLSNCKSVNTSFERHTKSITSHTLDSEIKAMLVNTQIINEEFYHLTRNTKEEDLNKRNSSNPRESINFCQLKSRHYSSCGFNDYLNNTFLNSTSMNFFEENKKNNLEPNEESEANKVHMKKCLYHYKGITEKIEQHLKDKQNFILGEIIQMFSTYFCSKNKKILKKIKDGYDRSMRKKYIEMIEESFLELKDFVKVFTIAICFFYNLPEYQRVLKYFLFTKENLQNFITSIIFDEQIYSIVFEGQSFIDLEVEEKFVIKLNELKNFNPCNFEISDKLCLNERTLKYFNEKKRVELKENNIYQSQVLTEQLLIEPDLAKQSTNLTTNKILLELRDNSIMQKSMQRTETFEEETCKVTEKKFSPYLKAIKNIKKIQKLQSPLHKLKNMRITVDLVEQEIQEFYQKHNIDFHFSLTGEEIMKIHMYIISKAEIPSMFTQYAISDKFLLSNTNSIADFYLSTMNVCLKNILGLDLDDNENSKDN